MRLADQQAQRLRRWLHLQGVLVGVHALGELDSPALDAIKHQAGAELVGRALARLIVRIPANVTVDSALS